MKKKKRLIKVWLNEKTVIINKKWMSRLTAFVDNDDDNDSHFSFFKIVFRDLTKNKLGYQQMQTRFVMFGNI